MVLSSLPAYLDPANWHQQQNHQDGSGLTSHFPPPLPPPQPPQPHGSGGVGSIRPGSMVDRARMANIPMLAEAAQKCPRCESTNTKFCYFNNYSLSQPRHFCKTCRRYWTRGGALKSVPVGGGCRRNKRSKGSSSKSPATSDPQIGSSSTSDQVPPLRFMPPIHHLTELSTAGEISLNFNRISGQMGKTSDLNFYLGSSGGGSILGGLEQWRLQQARQFPFMATGLDFSPGMYPIEGRVVETSGNVGGASQVVRPKLSGSGVSQLASVKMEDNQQLNLSRQFMEIQGNDQYWSSSSSAWTDPSGFSSSTHYESLHE